MTSKFVVKTSTFITALTLILSAPVAQAGFFDNGVPESDWMVESEVVTAPKGYRTMCQTQPALCEPDKASQQMVKVPASFTTGQSTEEAKQEMWEKLVDVNDSINWKISPASDKDIFGTPDVWTMPRRYGDCEDYAIAKKWELLRLGFKPEQLLYAVVEGKLSPYHAVLVVRTEWGTYVLDNMEKDVLPWRETGYTWVIRQSTQDPSKWVKLENRAEQPPIYAQTADAQSNQTASNQQNNLWDITTLRKE